MFGTQSWLVHCFQSVNFVFTTLHSRMKANLVADAMPRVEEPAPGSLHDVEGAQKEARIWPHFSQSRPLAGAVVCHYDSRPPSATPTEGTCVGQGHHTLIVQSNMSCEGTCNECGCKAQVLTTDHRLAPNTKTCNSCEETTEHQG